MWTRTPLLLHLQPHVPRALSTSTDSWIVNMSHICQPPAPAWAGSWAGCLAGVSTHPLLLRTHGNGLPRLALDLSPILALSETVFPPNSSPCRQGPACCTLVPRGLPESEGRMRWPTDTEGRGEQVR